MRSEQTLTNHRTASKKHLLAMGSQASFAASPLQVHKSIRDALNADIAGDGDSQKRSFKLDYG